MKQKIDYKKAAWMKETESLIIAKLPELTGKFTILKIWESLNYLYTCKNESAEVASQKIIAEFNK